MRIVTICTLAFAITGERTKAEEKEEEKTLRTMPSKTPTKGSSTSRLLAKAEPSMRVIVGLCNPWPVPRLSRHNLGIRVVELLAENLGLEWHFSWSCWCWIAKNEANDLALIWPLVPYNNVGGSVHRALTELQAGVEDLTIAHDDLDLDPQKWKMKIGGSASGNRGVKSVIDALGTDQFRRLRLGIGRPASGTRDRAEIRTYVLSAMESDVLSYWQQASVIFGALAEILAVVEG